MRELLLPRALAPGDLVAIAALSGPVERADLEHLDRAESTLRRMGFRVRRTPLLEPGRRRWWTSGSPVEQAAELNSLLRDPQVRAVIAHTGGQAVVGYLDLVDFAAIRADPKPILGFSDLSLLHLAIHARTGLVGFHADLATPGLGAAWQSAGDARRGELERLYFQLLTGTEAFGPLPTGPRWQCWRPGRAEGPLVGGLLNRVVRVQATRFALPLERFDGAVLFWEEMGGELSWIWSDLHALRHIGILDRIAAMVVGVPHQVGPADPAPGAPDLREIVLDVLADRDIPVLGGIDVGHAGPNLPMPLGIRACVDAARRELALLEPAVRRPA